MKIVHIITRLIVGGAQLNTLLSCRAQVAAGHDVTLVYGPIYGPEGSLLEEAKQTGAHLVELTSLRRPVLPWQDVRCYFALRRLIHRLNPDVVHTHSSKAGILGRAAAWHEHVPRVVHTVHGLPFHDQQPRWLHHAYVLAERWAAKRCHHLIAITPEMVRAFEQKRIASSDRFTVIPSGLDLERVAVDRASAGPAVRNEWGVPSTAPVVGVLGRLDRLKGQRDMLEVLPKLVEALPNLRLVFIGDGWDRPHVEQVVRDIGMDSRVIFTGRVSPDAVPRLLAAVDVKVLPSYQEGQSRTLAEALLAGCGIVAYDVGGIGSVCRDGDTGRLVPVGDREALREAIEWMFDHPEKRAAMVQRGAALVRKAFDARAMTDRIEAVYKSEYDGARSNRNSRE